MEQAHNNEADLEHQADEIHMTADNIEHTVIPNLRQEFFDASKEM